MQPGDTVVELTSGNTGTGLAIVCAAKGYRFVAVMSRGNSSERARMMAALGAEVVLVDQCPELDAGRSFRRRSRARRRTARRRSYAISAAPFAPTNSSYRAIRAHTTGIPRPRSCGSPAASTPSATFIGSGGSFAGCARYFKECDPAIQCYIVEPASARPPYAGEAVTRPNHRIQGGGYAMSDLALVDRALVDGCLQVSDADAIRK